MVNQNEDSQASIDPISVDQQQLDEQQGQVPSPQTATADDIAALQQTISAQARQIYGMQSKIDTGINAVAHRQEQAIQRGFEDIKQQMYGQNLLNQVPEEHREWMGPIMETLQKQNQPAPESLAPESQAMGDPQSDWQQVFDLVQQAGVNPQDSRMMEAYPLLTSGQQGAFMSRLAQVVREDASKGGSANGQARTQAPRQAQAQRTVSPPIESSPSAGRGLNSADDLRNAFIENKLDFPEYQKRMSALGESV